MDNKITFKERLKIFLKLSLKDTILVTPIVFSYYIQKYYNFHGKYIFHRNNIKGSEDLIIILAGYKDYLYDFIIPRIYNNIDRNIDVCIVTPGKYDQKIYEYT